MIPSRKGAAWMAENNKRPAGGPPHGPGGPHGPRGGFGGKPRDLKGTTVIIIAQRISSVQYADKIVVLDEGTVADVGTHDELMATSRIYREIYDSQQEGGGENG